MLGGTVIICDALRQDYCIREAIQCLQAFCDEIVVLDAGSTDGTREYIWDLTQHPRTKLVSVTNEEWLAQQGRTKLSYFTNVARDFLSTTWHFNLQADEILHQHCIWTVRNAIETASDDVQAFRVTRINLWGDPYHQLNVPQDRKPVSTEIIRLARTQYDSYDDAESLQAPAVDTILHDARIYHMGFVRDRRKHLVKIRHIQDEVFLIDHDKRIDGMTEFDPWAMGFTHEDVEPIKEPLPVFIQDWARTRP